MPGLSRWQRDARLDIAMPNRVFPSPRPQAARSSGSGGDDGRIKAVLGPTNTGKTHLAIERLCAHSSGAIGFPLRLLAREVYDRVCAIKGPAEVALITGEERIEPPGARWLLCTTEAMPVDADLAFVALDEAQLAADRERGHVFTDRLLHARGREETMILGSATLEPMVRQLLPGAEVISRPRFSTLSHAAPRKLSRIPPRSAIVAFSAEQVYTLAEMLRRFRGGAAVVMGALSPETRNRQVELYQSGEVDYLVATDAIGMGLNLDVSHVAFAGLSKFDGQRQRRLTPAEMAQIAGRAGRHQRDGTFSTLAGGSGPDGGRDVSFTPEEIYAIEEHRFAPLTRLFWREADPRYDSLAVLLTDLESPPPHDGLVPAPEAIDLAVLRRLAEDPEITGGLRDAVQVRRFWDVCRLPDFRQSGVETHARFVARLWEDLHHGQLDGGFVAKAIADLDNPAGDIDTLQMRIAAIRSWAYICQRPDWVLAREEMAARARAAEARLSDALHARLTERFVNRRTSVLMRKLGTDAGLLPVRLEDDAVLVDGELIGHLAGFRFLTDPKARLADRKLLLAAAERHLPMLLNQRAQLLMQQLANGEACIALDGAALCWDGEAVARLSAGKGILTPRLQPDAALAALPEAVRRDMLSALEAWLTRNLAPLDVLHRLDQASRDPQSGPELRALLIRLVEHGGVLTRADSGLEQLAPDQRTQLKRLGIRIGALDLFHPAMLKPAALNAWRTLRLLRGPDAARSGVPAGTPPVIRQNPRDPLPHGYRRLEQQAIRIDIAERLLHCAYEARGKASSKAFIIDPALAISSGLTPASHARLLRLAGFQPQTTRHLAKGAHGPPAPARWRWRPPRPAQRQAETRIAPTASSGAFARLAELVR